MAGNPRSAHNASPTSIDRAGDGIRTATVLIVEDNDATREAMAEVLELNCYNVIRASNGREALTFLEKNHHRVDLVLSDLVMPEIDGAKLYEILQDHNPLLKMIIITSYPPSNDGCELLERGQVYWLQKPVNSKRLLETVHHALQVE